MEQKKIFGLLYGITDLIIGVTAPLLWWAPLGLLNLFVCWWVVFRSGWF